MKIEDILKKQGEIYKDLISNEIVNEYDKSPKIDDREVAYASRGILLKIMGLLWDKGYDRIALDELIDFTHELKDEYDIRLYDYFFDFDGNLRSTDLLVDLLLLKRNNLVEVISDEYLFVKITKDGKDLCSKLTLEKNVEKGVLAVLKETTNLSYQRRENSRRFSREMNRRKYEH